MNWSSPIPGASRSLPARTSLLFRYTLCGARPNRRVTVHNVREDRVVCPHMSLLQVLHVAVLRRRKETAQALLDAGFPVGEESSRGWLALEVAVEAEDRPMVKVGHPSDECFLLSCECSSLLRP